MWKHRNRMTEDEDGICFDDLVSDEEETECKSFRQKLFGSKHREDDDDSRDDDIDGDDDCAEASVPGRSSGKLRLMAVVAVAAAAAVILWLSGLLRSDADTVYSALASSGTALGTCLDDSSSLLAAAEQLNTILNNGNFTMDLTIDKAEGPIAIHMDYSRREKLMSGVLNWSGTRKPGGVDVAFSADKKTMRLSAPELVEDVYGFRLGDFSEGRDHISKLLEYAPFDIPLPDRELAIFSPPDLDRLMKARAGESWTAFKKTVKVKEFASRNVQLGDNSRYCTIYRITWDPAAADKLARELSGVLTAVPVGIMTLLPNLDPDCRLFVDESGCVIGGDCSVLGKKYTVLMTGEEFFWEEISVEILTATQNARYLTGGLDITEEGIELRLSDEFCDVLCADYDNATGMFRVVLSNVTLVEGALLMKDRGVTLMLGSREDPVLCLEMGPLSVRPAVDDREYVDIPSMSINEWNRVVVELKNNLFG